MIVALEGHGQGQGQGQGQDVQGVQAGGTHSEEDSFVAEAALYGWSVVGSSRPRPRRRRHPSGTNTNDFDDDEDEDGEDENVEEGEVVATAGDNPTGSNSISGQGNSNTVLPSEINHPHHGLNSASPSATTTASTNYTPSNTQVLPNTSTSSIYGDEDSPMPAVHSIASSSSSFSSSSSTGSTSFVRDMMHRLEDMPRLQSFVLNGVEYTRMSSLMTAR